MKISDIFRSKKFAIRCRGIILDEGKLLVVKHVKGGAFAVLPGGHLEWKEDIKECFRREIVEELGITPQIGRLLYINNFIDGKKQSIEFFFEVLNSRDYRNSKDIPRTHAYEIVEMCWLAPDDDTIILPEKLGEDFKSGKILSDEVKYIYTLETNRE